MRKISVALNYSMSIIDDMQQVEYKIILGVTRSYKREYFLNKITKTKTFTASEDFPQTFKTLEAAEAALLKWAA